jgi:hypothetical protein
VIQKVHSNFPEISYICVKEGILSDGFSWLLRFVYDHMESNSDMYSLFGIMYERDFEFEYSK